MEKLIAFQTVDSENDIWCNKALLFESEEKVIEFFNDRKKVLETLDVELVDGESIDNINYEIHNQNPANLINSVTFKCEYCGTERIVRMNSGFFIQ